MEIKKTENGYDIPGFGPVRDGADGEAGQRLAEVLRRIAEGIDTLVPYVPPPPPTAQEKRKAQYAIILGPLAIDYISLLADNADIATVNAKLAEIKTEKQKIDVAIPNDVVEG
jgi:hypothetical protein